MKRLRNSVPMLRVTFFDGAPQCLFESAFSLINSGEPFAGISFFQCCPVA
jgi:hypothetical protein